jgi:hypothetical protein
MLTTGTIKSNASQGESLRLLNRLTIIAISGISDNKPNKKVITQRIVGNTET